MAVTRLARRLCQSTAVTRLAAPSHDGLQYSTEASATSVEAPAVVGRVVVKASPMLAPRLC
eukprot:jgi/Chrpa1/27899/Chrysochromulina_OHIO_Genome00006843-RA